jgi:hypothetical protein
VRRNPRRLALELALLEHATLFPTGALVDRSHPARGEPGVVGLFSLPAFGQATFRHAVFGVLLGGLADLDEAEAETEAPHPGGEKSTRHPRSA